MSQIDKKTFEQLVRAYTPNMYRLAFGILNQRADAEDAVSEAILKAYENLHTLRRKERFQAWIMQITANEARRLYTRNKRVVPIENMEAYMPIFQDEHHELWDVVMEMETAYREVVMLYFYERFSIKEIAMILDIPEGTVKSRLSRGKKQLREKLS